MKETKDKQDKLKITISMDKSIEENAASYFEKAKKAKKKLAGAQKAIEEIERNMEKRLQGQAQKQQEREARHKEKARKKEWYEKFRWFLSSDGFLVIGGKDAGSNETIIKKQMEKNDSVFHTDAPGSPFVVIKNPEGKEIPEQTRNEAAIFAATYSKAWELGLKSTDVFEVKPDQVTKQAKAGEYIQKGGFMIYGKRKNYKPSLSLAIGIIDDENGRKVMGGPETAIRKHCAKAIALKQGDLKKSEAANKIMKKLEVHVNEDILVALPAGKFAVIK